MIRSTNLILIFMAICAYVIASKFSVPRLFLVKVFKMEQLLRIPTLRSQALLIAEYNGVSCLGKINNKKLH